MAVCKVQGMIVPSVTTMSGFCMTVAFSPSRTVGFSRAAKGELSGAGAPGALRHSLLPALLPAAIAAQEAVRCHQLQKTP